MSDYGERIAALEKSQGTDHEWISGLEGRVRELEAVMNKAKGGWAIIAGICAGSGVIGGIIAKLIHS